ncbi:hypothetical protein [Hymenobacter nivis]|nr:hypothetical protein [Hymenobacter nivis]
MKERFLFGAYLVALAASPVRAQTGGPDVVMVQLKENGAGTVRG